MVYIRQLEQGNAKKGGLTAAIKKKNKKVLAWQLINIW